MKVDVNEFWNQIRDELGDLVPDTGELPRLAGRNINHVVRTDRGQYFVKVLLELDSDRRVTNSLGYDHFAARVSAAPRSPRCLVAERELGILIFEYLADVESGAQLMVEERFTPETATALGRAVATLHLGEVALTPGELVSLPAPYPELLRGFPLHGLPELTGGELKAWSLLQADDAVRAALTDLNARSRAVPSAPVHGDLRVDQVLVDAEGRPWIIDWEEFGAADPARDTGSFLGEWLYRTVLDIPTSRGDGVELPDGSSTADLVGRGHAKLARLRPITEAFWQSYHRTRATAGRPVDDDFSHRTAGFVGWHLLDRFVAGSALSGHLPAIHRAAAGVGRAALLNPVGVLELLGLEEPR